jgi:hypothetical protein
MLSLKRLAWWAMRLAAPFVPLMHELTEVKYLWNQPVRLRNERLASTNRPRAAHQWFGPSRPK